MGALAAAVALKQSKLTVGQHPEPVLAAIQVPEVDVAIRRPTDAACSEAPQGHAVIGAIVEIAGIAHRIGLFPAQSEGLAPAGLRGLPRRCLALTTEQRRQSGETERSHAQGRKSPHTGRPGGTGQGPSTSRSADPRSHLDDTHPAHTSCKPPASLSSNASRVTAVRTIA